MTFAGSLISGSSDQWLGWTSAHLQRLVQFFKGWAIMADQPLAYSESVWVTGVGCHNQPAGALRRG